MTHDRLAATYDEAHPHGKASEAPKPDLAPEERAVIAERVADLEHVEIAEPEGSDTSEASIDEVAKTDFAGIASHEVAR